jgi:Ca-activated chloride channel family protein
MNSTRLSPRILAGSLLLAFLFVPMVFAGQIQLSVSLGKPVMIAGEKNLNYLKIGLHGGEIPGEAKRAPVNLALVIDKSGSMQGKKLESAKKAAILAIDHLAANDIISIIAYDSNVEVLFPASKAEDREALRRAIERLEAGSNTALFAGVSKGARELRKFLSKEYVNRIILLSDGLANEGPSTPAELAELGSSLRREGIAVTTFGLGLGYNEDLMAQLARSSDGNHAFIEEPQELARYFNLEFGDVLNVVAQDVEIKVNGYQVRPTRVLGRDADIRDMTVKAGMNQLYSRQEKFILLELEVPATETLSPRHLAEVQVTYLNLLTRSRDSLSQEVSIRFSRDPEEVRARENREVMVDVVHLIGNERYKLATRLRDEGKIEESRQALIANKEYLEGYADQLKSDKLKKFSIQNVKDAENLDESSWGRTRKGMRMEQQKADYQQSY